MATTKKAQPKTGAAPSSRPKAKKKASPSKNETVSNEIIGSGIPDNSIDLNLKVTPIKADKETVAIHSTRNVSWEGVGKVEKGYNIVKKSAAEKWLTRDHTRLATPEEVAREYGV